VHYTKKYGTRDAARKTSNLTGCEINRKSVTETLIHKCYVLIVWRKVGSLAEVRNHLNVGRQVIKRGAGLALSKQRSCEQKGCYDVFHRV
jgi:hypothetical protein